MGVNRNKGYFKVVVALSVNCTFLAKKIGERFLAKCASFGEFNQYVKRCVECNEMQDSCLLEKHDISMWNVITNFM